MSEDHGAALAACARRSASDQARAEPDRRSNAVRLVDGAWPRSARRILQACPARLTPWRIAEKWDSQLSCIDMDPRVRPMPFAHSAARFAGMCRATRTPGQCSQDG